MGGVKILLNAFEKNKSVVLEEEIVPEDFDLDIDLMQFPETLQLRAELWKTDKDLTVQAHVEGPCHLTCSRCLEEFNNLFEKDFTLHYDIKGLDSLSIDQDVRDEIILENPIRVICKNGCRGLCPFCGANLNNEQCGCKPAE